MSDFDGPSFNDFVNRGSQQLLPMFSMKAIQNNFKSEKEGRPIFEDKEWVEIFIPGDKNTTVSREVRDDDRKRWPEQYRAFKEGKEIPLEGTPLEQWPVISASTAKELEHFKVRTVEQLSEIPDGLLKNLGMGSLKLREQAREWLKTSQKSAAANALVKRADDLQEELRLANVTIEALKSEIEDLKEKLKKG